MTERTSGRYERTFVAGETVDAFVPFPLPPEELVWDEQRLQQLRVEAEQALARLDVAADMLPSLNWFVYAFVRKEAVLSAQIEGTQATLVDLLASEARAEGDDRLGVVRDADVEEVTNYLAALAFARDTLASERGVPLSMRLLNGAHERLMQGVRGADKRPGEIRRTQNWIGGRRPGQAVFVPPPPQLLPELLSDFERYMHRAPSLPPVLSAALLHVQFETIHPYLDGNGRIGRLLITLLLEHWQLLRAPVLYLSLYFKRHRAEYYRRLSAVRTDGDWEGWLAFFLDGVTTIADEAVGAAQELFALVSEDRATLLAIDGISVSTIRLFEQLPRHPIVTTGAVMRLVQTTKPTAGKVIDQLMSAGVLRETTGKRRDREYVYDRYLRVLRDGTELP